MVKIGIPMRYAKNEYGKNILYMSEMLRRTVQKAGGFIIPIMQVQDVSYYETRYNEFEELTDKEKEIIDEYLNMVNGVIFPGGQKITPFDRYLLERCIELDKKVLGICLGMQLLSCYGEYFQTYKNDSFINHDQIVDEGFSHTVKIDRDSKLYEIIGKDEVLVNSFHNNHINDSKNYKVVAKSEDGYVEAVELSDKLFNIGIQWHPEISYNFDPDSRKIIDYFIKVCGEE